MRSTRSPTSPEGAAASTETSRRTWRGRALSLVSALGASGLLLWTIGQVFRDRTWLSGLCFYIPSPVLAFALLAAAAASLVARRRRSAFLLLLAAAPPASFVAGLENRWSRPDPVVTGEPLRLVHWNVMFGELAWNPVKAILRDCEADLYVVSEFPRGKNPGPTARFLGDFRFLQEGSMVVFARGVLESRGRLSRDDKLECHVFRWTYRGTTLDVMLGDIASDLLVARDPQLRRLERFIRQRKPDLVVGDLNAPRRSRRLAALPAGYRHAYDAAGCGWSYTWPVPLPVYAIDQCIAGERIRPLRYELRSTLRSDHRLQILEFVVRDERRADSTQSSR